MENEEIEKAENEEIEKAENEKNEKAENEADTASVSTATEETNSSCDSSALTEDDEIPILCEVVGAYHLTSDDGGKEEMRPYCIIKFDEEVIHRTKPSAEAGCNPIWTVSNRSLFLLKVTPRELAHHDLDVSLWSKRKDPLNLTTLKRSFLGKAVVDCRTILSHCDEHHVVIDLHGEDANGDIDTASAPSRGSLALRFRMATPSDEKFLHLFEKRPELLKQQSMRNVNKSIEERSQAADSAVTSIPVSAVANRRPIAPLVTETDETEVAGASLVNAISSAFTSRTCYDESGNQKVLVKPHPDPTRVKETTYLTKQEFRTETESPSREWVEAGSGTLGKLYLEILSCHDLPNVDVGEAVGNLTDCFVAAVFEDAMVQTPVIDDELSPHWPSWTQRAFCFGMIHPASVLYLSAFDFDLGITDHEPLGRVAVNIRNLQRDTDYTLNYKLYPSSNVTDRISSGVIKIRLRIEYKDEKEALLAALRPRPKFHVNVQKKKSLSVLRYTCFGEYGDDNEEKFDLTVLRSYISEIFEYKTAVSYTCGDAFRSLIFWRGQVQVCGMLLPLHSLLFFCAGRTLVERPCLAPSFFLLSVAWIMLATQRQRLQHPSPWSRCPSFWQYVEILKTGKSSLSVKEIGVNEGAREAEAFEKAWNDRLEEDGKAAATKRAMQQEIKDLGDVSIHTKTAGSIIPLQMLETLGRYQGIIGRYCRHFRFIKIIVTWEESLLSFWITACFLVGGFVSLLLPWSFILTWTGRILVWGFLGPHMKLVDLVLHANADKDDKDDRALQKAFENFQKQSRSARLRRQEALKLKEIKCLVFGQYITRVPSFNLSRHADRPLPESFAKLHTGESNDIQIAPYYVPGQQFFGAIIPRTQPQALQYEEELPRLRRMLTAVDSLVNSILEAETNELIMRLRSQGSRNDVEYVSEGYEMIAFENGDDSSEAELQLQHSSSLTIDTQSQVAVLSPKSKRTSERRRSSTMRGGYELIALDEEDEGYETRKGLSVRMGESSPLEMRSSKKLAILQVEEERRKSLLRKSVVGKAGPLNALELPILEEEGEGEELGGTGEDEGEGELGGVEVVLCTAEPKHHGVDGDSNSDADSDDDGTDSDDDGTESSNDEDGGSGGAENSNDDDHDVTDDGDVVAPADEKQQTEAKKDNISLEETEAEEGPILSPTDDKTLPAQAAGSIVVYYQPSI